MLFQVSIWFLLEKTFEKCDGEELRDSAGIGLGQGKAIFIPTERQFSSLQGREN